MMKDLVKRLQEKEEKMIEIRRHLHEHPELSFQESETPKYITDFYKDKDCEVKTNVGENGVKVTIDSGNPGKQLRLEQTLMHYQSKKILDCHLRLKMMV